MLQTNKMQKLISRKQNRLKNYDYSDNGWYFITVCSKDRKNIFGKYKNLVGAALVSARNNIKLSIIGKIIDTQWNNIKNQYKNIELDEYIIMPNHLHGIIIINNRAQTSGAPTISQIIRSFKSKSTLAYLNHLKQNNMKFPVNLWQRNFHDHIIRNDKSLNKIREYIINNPINWQFDIENSDRTGNIKTSEIFA